MIRLIALAAAIITPSVAYADNGWSEAQRGAPVDLSGAKLIYGEKFNGTTLPLGTVLQAKQHADVGLEKFDPINGKAYSEQSGALAITAYQDGATIRSGHVQTTTSAQAYDGALIAQGKTGFTCTACYFEAKVRFPMVEGTWASFWLLSLDDPKKRGHLEVDAIEYYGITDPRGHHHTIHRWGVSEPNGHTSRGDYTGMDAIADGGWHLYGADLRGKAMLNGKPAIVVTMDGKEVARIAADADYFTRPFYMNMTLSINPKDVPATLPQTVLFDYVRAWR